MEPQGVPWSVWKPVTSHGLCGNLSRPVVCVEISVTSHGLCGNLSHVSWSVWKPQSRPLVCVETSDTFPGLCGNLSHVPLTVWKPQTRFLVCVEISVTSLCLCGNLSHVPLCGNLSHVPWSVWKPQSRSVVCVETAVTFPGLCGNRSHVPWSVWKPQSCSVLCVVPGTSTAVTDADGCGLLGKQSAVRHGVLHPHQNASVSVPASQIQEHEPHFYNTGDCCVQHRQQSVTCRHCSVGGGGGRGEVSQDWHWC